MLGQTKSLLKSFVAPGYLREEEPLFTLDKNGSLVVSLDVIFESGQLNNQIKGASRLRRLSKQNRSK